MGRPASWVTISAGLGIREKGCPISRATFISSEMGMYSNVIALPVSLYGYRSASVILLCLVFFIKELRLWFYLNYAWEVGFREW